MQDAPGVDPNPSGLPSQLRQDVPQLLPDLEHLGHAPDRPRLPVLHLHELLEELRPDRVLLPLRRQRHLRRRGLRLLPERHPLRPPLVHRVLAEVEAVAVEVGPRQRGFGEDLEEPYVQTDVVVQELLQQTLFLDLLQVP